MVKSMFKRPIRRKIQNGGFDANNTLSIFRSGWMNANDTLPYSTIGNPYDAVVWSNPRAMDQSYPKAIVDDDAVVDNVSVNNFFEDKALADLIAEIEKQDVDEIEQRYPELRLAHDFVRYGLSEREKTVLQAYTGNNFYHINAGLRHYYHGSDHGRHYVTPSMVEDVKIMDDIFRKAPKLSKPLKVYRGMVDFSHDTNLTGPFISTSLEQSVAKRFSRWNPLVLEIEVMAGTPILPLYGISHYSHEQEILLPRTGRVKLRNHRIDENYGEVVELSFEQPSAGWIDSLLTSLVPDDHENAINNGEYDNKPFETIPKSISITSWDTVMTWCALLFSAITLKRIRRKQGST